MIARHRPDVLFLMTDQHRWDAIGAVQPLVQTPNLDRLCAMGVRFSQAVCQVPICVPSRYSVMTGLYGSQSGVRFNRQIVMRDEDLPAPTLPQRFADLGYQTAGFGKTHWYEAGFGIDRPSRRGFAHRAVINEGLAHIAEDGAACMEEEYGLPVPSFAESRDAGPGGEGVAGYLGRTSAHAGDHHREGWFTRKAVEFLDRDRDPSRPMLLYLSLDYPHAPLYVPPGYEERYRVADIPDRIVAEAGERLEEHWIQPHYLPVRQRWHALDREARRRTTLRYFALCSYVDSLFGQVLDRLERAGTLDSTVIAWTSDHGDMLGDRNHRFGKYCLYEGSIRVPLLLAGACVPQHLRGTVDDRPAELVDLLPTLLAAVEAPVPAGLPGLNLLGDVRRSGSFAEFHGGGYEDHQAGPMWMWRTPEWKLILAQPDPSAARVPGPPRGELYHLTQDPVELRNRWDDPACAGVREELTRALLAHIMSVSSRFPRQTTDVPLALRPQNVLS